MCINISLTICTLIFNISIFIVCKCTNVFEMYLGRSISSRARSSFFCANHYLSRIVRKPNFCLYENKGADQLCSNCESDQRLCFRYSDLYLYRKFQDSNFLLWLHRSVCVRPGRKPRRPVFSRRGSFCT